MHKYSIFLIVSLIVMWVVTFIFFNSWFFNSWINIIGLSLLSLAWITRVIIDENVRIERDNGLIG